MNTRAMIRQLLPNLYLIDDAGESTCYVLCGKEKAMVIDTLNGAEDLHAIVRTLTDLPLIVVNTHGHVDHVGCNPYFREACIHPDDLALAQEHLGYYKDIFAEKNLTPCPFRLINAGEVIDLGGLEVEVVSLRGHTAGSIGILDRQDRLLFSGDGLNPHLWMQLDHSLSIAELKETILALKAAHGAEFDHVLTGHAKDLRSAELVDQLLQGCCDLLEGRTQGDQPYEFFGGQALQHPITDVPGEVIVYTADKL